MGGLDKSFELVELFVVKSGEVRLVLILDDPWSLDYKLVSHPKILLCQEN